MKWCALGTVLVLLWTGACDALNRHRASGTKIAPGGPETADVLRERIKSPRKTVKLSEKYAIATVEGRWRDVAPKKYFFTTPTLNSVHILCGKTELQCTETIASVYVRALDGDRLGAPDGELDAYTNEYHVTEWSADRIVALKEMPVAVLELRIFAQEQTADRTYVEKQDPAVFSRYILE